MKKKMIALLMGAAMAATLTACGGSSAKVETVANETQATAAAQATEAAKEENKEAKGAESAASASSWTPEENVTMIVAYKAGSGTDNTARILSQYATKYIGQTVVIENQEGGSGSIGWTALANAKPDGYTLGFVNLPTLCSNIVEKLGDYTMEDFVPICNHVNETAMVMVKADSQFNTLEELVEYAKAHPGELKASTNGNKASNHIGVQLLAKSAEFEYTDIPYGGTADQLLALRQGEVDFTVAKEADIASMTSEVKVLGVYDTKRLDNYPDVPTLGELGYYDQWYGSARAIVAPKGTPQEVIDFYAEAFKAAMEDPEYIAAAEKAGVSTLYMDPAETGKLLDDQFTFCRDTVAGLWN